jgi:hypothetical protein
MKQRDFNCLSYWFPKLEEIGIPVPRTEIVQFVEDISQYFFDGEVNPLLDAYIEEIKDACNKIGYPCFLRSGHTSAKHSWNKSCFVTDPDCVGYSVYEICEFSEICDMIGLPTNVWAARELLPTHPIFTAFHGQMPITAEFRLFVKDEKCTHIQPYWPADCIERPSVPDWEERLAEISLLCDEDRSYLVGQSERIGKHIGGYWSIDWLFATDRGWTCTDMADGDRSFRWEGGL